MPWTEEQNAKFSQKLSEYWYTSLKNKKGLGIAWIRLAKRFSYDIANKTLDAIWESQERQGFMPGPRRFLEEAMAIQRWNEHCAPVVSPGGKDLSREPIVTLRYFYATTFENPNLLSGDAETKARKLDFMQRTRKAVMAGASLGDILAGRVGKPEKDDEVPF
jgi:hypothetical protein